MRVVFLGLALAVLGPAAYFGLTWLTALPRGLVENPWPFEALSILGFVIAAFGSISALRAHRRAKRSMAVTLVTVVGLVGMLGYIHWLSSRLPDPPPAFATGAVPPALDLPAIDGTRVSLDSLRGKKTVLVFFRGSWCGFCRTELAALAREIGPIREAGADVVAISSSSLEKSKDLSQELGLPFRLASDPELVAITAWDLLDPMVGTYARPATILLGTDGRIHASWFPDDWRVRVPPADIAAAARATP